MEIIKINFEKAEENFFQTDQELFTVNEFADIFGKSYTWAYGLIQRKVVKSSVDITRGAKKRHYFVHRKSVLELIKNKGVKAF